LLALLPAPGRRSQALAAALPPPWQAIHTPVTSSSSSSSTSRAKALQLQDAPSGSAAQLEDLALLGSPVNSGLVEQPAAVTNSSDTALTAVTSRLSAPSSRSTVISSSAVSSSSPTAAFPAPSSSTTPGSSSSSSASSPGGGSSSSSAAPAAALSSSGLEDLLAYERAAVNLFEAAVPSVVNITHMRAMQVKLNQQSAMFRAALLPAAVLRMQLAIGLHTLAVAWTPAELPTLCA
jgi:hypothetical protein